MVSNQVTEGVEFTLNISGYKLLGQKKFNEAIEYLSLMLNFIPNSLNTYDSLGEAYAAAGDKKLAIENYEKSIKLFTDGDAIGIYSMACYSIMARYNLSTEHQIIVRSASPHL
nr:hypothetical protein [Segetibacter sp.]